MQDFSIYLICDTMPFICKYALLMIASDDLSLSDPVSYQAYIGHYPAGAAIKTIFQFL